jgi:hypothetical protein
MKQPSFLSRRGLHFLVSMPRAAQAADDVRPSPLSLRLPAALYARSLATITDIRFRMHDEGSIDYQHARETLLDQYRVAAADQPFSHFFSAASVTSAESVAIAAPLTTKLAPDSD